MKNFRKLTIIVTISIILLFGFLLIRYFITQSDESDKKIDFSEIQKRGKIIVVTNTNAIDYFIYQGQPMGFQLEILDEFAKHFKLELEIIVENEFDKGIEYLMDRKCDILSQNIIITTERDLIHEFTVPILQTKQVLVQRKPKDFKSMTNEQIDDSLIRNLTDLKAKTIYIQKGSPNLTSLQNIANEIVQNFFVIEIDSLSPEQIIKNVADGLYDYAVCDLNIAKITQCYYSNIDVKTEISFPQNIAWAVRPESLVLLDSLNVWLTEFKTTERYTNIYNKYINNNRILVDLESEFYSGNEGKISNYDDLLKKYSKEIGWDWRLLASLVYEESRFNPDAKSWAGAFGLMQLMPNIYANFSNDSVANIESQISAGVKYISFLYESIPKNVSDSIDKVKMVLAGYNIGFGHIEDAIKLSEKYGKNSGDWNEVSKFVINLSNPKYYQDTLVKHGYFPGIYSIDFVNNIETRYLHYKNIIPL
jgi:membrane-bound lytic murein transglycosylase F